jgi:putative SOS response-associated peptidase YedK
MIDKLHQLPQQVDDWPDPMCGRVRLSSDYSEIKIQFRMPPQVDIPNFGPNWNGAPTQILPVARFDAETGHCRLDLARWGLLPFWAKDAKLSYSTFNARAETVATQPAFRDAFKRGRRCLVPVDSFYEWQTLGPKEKQPHAIALASGRVMALAGLWDTWKNPVSDESIRSYTIITCTPNDRMAQIHNRMPVILPEASWEAWLGEKPVTPGELQDLLRPCPSDDLVMWPVDKRVGNVRNNDPSLIEPINMPW